MKRLWPLLVLLSSPAWGHTLVRRIANFPACNGQPHTVWSLDSTSTSDCTTGGGDLHVPCGCRNGQYLSLLAGGEGGGPLSGDVDGDPGSTDLDEAAVEAELEAVLDLPELQGVLTDSQIPNSITIDLATLATSCTTALAGDSATSFFPSGTFADGLVDGSLEADEVNPTLGTQTQGTYVAGATPSQGLALTGTEGGTLGLGDCAANQVWKRNAGDTAWECAADATGGGGGGNFVEVSMALTDSGVYSQAVTGQSWVTSGSLIVCSPFGTTADGLTPEAVALSGLELSVSDRVAGVGFTLYVLSPRGLAGTVRIHCTGS